LPQSWIIIGCAATKPSFESAHPSLVGSIAELDLFALFLLLYFEATWSLLFFSFTFLISRFCSTLLLTRRYLRIISFHHITLHINPSNIQNLTLHYYKPKSPQLATPLFPPPCVSLLIRAKQFHLLTHSPIYLILT